MVSLLPSSGLGSRKIVYFSIRAQRFNAVPIRQRAVKADSEISANLWQIPMHLFTTT